MGILRARGAWGPWNRLREYEPPKDYDCGAKDGRRDCESAGEGGSDDETKIVFLDMGESMTKLRCRTMGHVQYSDFCFYLIKEGTVERYDFCPRCKSSVVRKLDGGYAEKLCKELDAARYVEPVLRMDGENPDALEWLESNKTQEWLAVREAERQIRGIREKYERARELEREL